MTFLSVFQSHSIYSFGLTIKEPVLLRGQRQDKRATVVEGNPKAPFSLASTVTYGINRNSRQGGGATPLPLHAQLVPSNTGTHFTYHEWMES